MTPAQRNIIKVLEVCRQSCKRWNFCFGFIVLIFWLMMFLNMQSFGEGLGFCFDASKEDFRLEAKVIKKIRAASGVDCILQCMLQNESCRSTNFRKTQTCEEQENCELLNAVYSEEPTENLKKDENFDHYKLLQPERKPENVVLPITTPISKSTCEFGEAAFGMESGRIQDSQITASSFFRKSRTSRQGRLNGATSWTAGTNDRNRWIQVDLGGKGVVTKIGTQGRQSNYIYVQWVESYSVYYSCNGTLFEPYKIDGVAKIFSGNNDKNSIVTNSFSPPITARYIRIRPLSWKRYVSMRFEVYGCYTDAGPCKFGEAAFGMQNGRIQDSQITASSSYNTQTPEKGRLNSGSAWSAEIANVDHWIQVDLGREGVVTAIGTQGHPDDSEWVETYNVLLGSNGNVFQHYKIDGAVKVFKGNSDKNSIVTNSLSPAITARYIRIHALSWHGQRVSMRFEIYGCYTAKSCLDHYKSGNKADDIYPIYPDGNGNFPVKCDINGGGWTVFQHRFDGSVDFYLGWMEYKEGFGNMYGEFWLGLKKLHRITTSGKYKLRIDLEDFEGNKRFAEYSFFKIGNENDGFRLNIGAYSGDAGDSLLYHDNLKFSTKDMAHENGGDSCARAFKGAWWYGDCLESNLNGLYYSDGHNSSFGNGISWFGWKGRHYSMKTVTMKIKEV